MAPKSLYNIVDANKNVCTRKYIFFVLKNRQTFG